MIYPLLISFRAAFHVRHHWYTLELTHSQVLHEEEKLPLDLERALNCRLSTVRNEMGRSQQTELTFRRYERCVKIKKRWIGKDKRMQQRTLGNGKLAVSELGLGCMGLTSFYGTPADEDEAIRLIHRAID